MVFSEKRWHMASQHGRKACRTAAGEQSAGFGSALATAADPLKRAQESLLISHQQTSAKGETETDSDRYLNPIVTHRSTLIRYPATTMTRPGQKNFVGMNEGGTAEAVTGRQPASAILATSRICIAYRDRHD
jgi:hypothetical protein